MQFVKKWQRSITVLPLVAFLVFPIPKVFIEEWSVQVNDQEGRPVSAIRVSRGWDNFTFGLGGGEDLYTNAEGKVVFRKQIRRRPSAYWIGRVAWNVVNLGFHFSSGTTGSVRITDSDRDWEPSPNQPHSAVCRNADCTSNKLNSELRVILAHAQ